METEKNENRKRYFREYYTSIEKREMGRIKQKGDDLKRKLNHLK